jgi:signal transduction histidine kinase
MRQEENGPPVESAVIRDYMHRMSQPLTAIMGYAEMLSRRLPAGTNERHFAERILAESERLTGMLTSLSDTAKGLPGEIEPPGK